MLPEWLLCDERFQLGHELRDGDQARRSASIRASSAASRRSSRPTSACAPARSRLRSASGGAPKRLERLGAQKRRAADSSRPLGLAGMASCRPNAVRRSGSPARSEFARPRAVHDSAGSPSEPGPKTWFFSRLDGADSDLLDRTDRSRPILREDQEQHHRSVLPATSSHLAIDRPSSPTRSRAENPNSIWRPLLDCGRHAHHVRARNVRAQRFTAD
jgi:hypothetical protein